MADIELKLTQAAFDGTLLNNPDQGGGDLFASLGMMMVGAAAGVQDDSADVSNFVLSGGKLRLDFPDQSYDEFTGVTVADPGARKGTGMATAASLFIPREGISEQTGLYRFSYDMTGTVPTATRISSLTESIKVSTLFPESSPWYDRVLGNGSLSARGAITVDAGGRLGGSIDSVSMTADKLLLSASIQGTFKLSGNVRAIEEGDEELGVSGVLNSLDLQFRDGSLARMSGLEAQVDGLGLDGALALPGSGLAGADTIRVELPARIGQAFTVASGDGDDSIVLGGGGGLLHAAGGAGRDTITLLSDHHHVDGGAGLDTVVFQGARADYTVRKNGLMVEVAGTGGGAQLGEVERLRFGKDMLAFDIDGSAGQVYRIYQAALDRAPEKDGLGFWISVLDRLGDTDVVAQGFLASPEFAERYSTNTSNARYVTDLYNNVLHRPYEQSGYDFWLSKLDQGVPRSMVLAAFAESPENKAQVLAAIQDGIEYTLYGA